MVKVAYSLKALDWKIVLNNFNFCSKLTVYTVNFKQYEQFKIKNVCDEGD